MSQLVTINITTGNESVKTIQDLFLKQTSNQRQEALQISGYFAALEGGVRNGKFDVVVNGDSSVAASGTLTFSSAGVATDTASINGVVFTAVASGATGNQWNVGATATISAANLASAINASATALVSGQVTAVAASGVITLTAIAKGVTGNAITIAGGQADIVASGARLTGGVAATPNVYRFGV
ncbi:MAG: hypothetical protein NVS3B3_06770 [Aquirhabdus sp.]